MVTEAIKIRIFYCNIIFITQLDRAESPWLLNSFNVLLIYSVAYYVSISKKKIL